MSIWELLCELHQKREKQKEEKQDDSAQILM